MSIVDVYSYLIGQRVDSLVVLKMLFEYGLYGSRYEEILLLESEHLAFLMVVCGIKHFTDTLCKSLLLQRLDVFALGKKFHIEIHGSLCSPKSQLVYSRHVVTADIHIVRDCFYRIAVLLLYVKSVLLPSLLYSSAEFYGKGIFHTGRQPYVAVFQPFVGKFYLPTVFNLLFENTVIVSYGKTACYVIEIGKRFHISSRKSSQSSVA